MQGFIHQATLGIQILRLPLLSFEQSYKESEASKPHAMTEISKGLSDNLKLKCYILAKLNPFTH